MHSPSEIQNDGGVFGGAEADTRSNRDAKYKGTARAERATS